MVLSRFVNRPQDFLGHPFSSCSLLQEENLISTLEPLSQSEKLPVLHGKAQSQGIPHTVE